MMYKLKNKQLIHLTKGKHNIEDNYTKKLSDLSFNNTFGFE